MQKMSTETSCASKKRKLDPNESPGKKRRDGSDIVQFLKEQSEMEFQFKWEKLEAEKS